MKTSYYLACDLGIERSRIVLGSLCKGHLTLDDLHVFENPTCDFHGQLCWDIPALESEIFTGLQKAAHLDLPIAGLSASSVRVDYVLLDQRGEPIRPPVYGSGNGDHRELELDGLSPASLFVETGMAPKSGSMLAQLEADRQADPQSFSRAHRLLPLADFLNARFSGTIACEESLAGATQLYNPKTHAWSAKIAEALHLPESLLPRLVPSGTAFGPVVGRLRQNPGMLTTRVVAGCSHGPAAALSAVPARPEQRWACLHSDLRSRFGLEVPSPILTSQARENGFMNLVGLGGAIHLVKESPALDLVRECRRAWANAGNHYSETDLIKLAAEAEPADAHLDLSDPRLHQPGEMPDKIAALCRELGLPVPQTPGQVVRLILESLALAHGETLRQLEALTNQEIEVLHVVGRGSRHDFLNQLISDVTGLPVVVGPADATAIGNILIQALALWHLSSAEHLRSLVASSFPTRVLKPHGAAHLAPVEQPEPVFA